MRYLISTALLFVFISSQAYVVKGVRTTILIERINRIELKELSIEGCDTGLVQGQKIKASVYAHKWRKLFEPLQIIPNWKHRLC